MKYFLFFLSVVSCFLVNAQEFGARYELVGIGRQVNTGYHEGGPIISPDGKTLYFFVHNHPDNHYGKEGSQDIWYSTLGEDGEWSEAKHLDRPINEHHSNQVFTILDGGRTLFIRGGSSRNSKGFAFTYDQGGSWSKPDEIDVDDFKKMNNGKFYGATMSSDRRAIIIYMSEKENSTWSDLYLSTMLSPGKYSRPVKLPDNINTGRDEFAPFLGPDDKTMYFASSRKDIGFGNADIYSTKRLDDTWMKWSDPVNMGRPINTSQFDGYFSIDEQGDVFVAQAGATVDGGNLDIFKVVPKKITVTLRGLVTDTKTNAGLKATLIINKDGKPVDTLATESGGSYSTKLKGEGNFKIKVAAFDHHPGSGSFTLVDVFNDTTVIQDFSLKGIDHNAVLTGMVYNAKTSEAISAKVEIKIKEGQLKFEKKANEGYYEEELTKKGRYMITAIAEGFLNATDSIDYTSSDQTALSKDLYLQPIEVGATVRLDHIYFDFDKTTLKKESFEELDKVVDFLTSNETVEIEIAGHTDSKGSDEYNLNLSQGRAEAVVEYLISHGIDSHRLLAKGYGETAPVATNDTDEGRAENRRVEFTILKK